MLQHCSYFKQYCNCT